MEIKGPKGYRDFWVYRQWFHWFGMCNDERSDSDTETGDVTIPEIPVAKLFHIFRAHLRTQWSVANAPISKSYVHFESIHIWWNKLFIANLNSIPTGKITEWLVLSLTMMKRRRNLAFFFESGRNSSLELSMIMYFWLGWRYEWEEIVLACLWHE